MLGASDLAHVALPSATKISPQAQHVELAVGVKDFQPQTEKSDQSISAAFAGIY